jgi:protein-S-isoprenylcysteine O-methyltransferase Ste14
MEPSSQTQKQPAGTLQLLKLAVNRFAFIMILLALLVLVPAGTIHYWQFYLYCASFIIPMCFTLVYFIKKDPEFLARRMKGTEQEHEQRLVVFATVIIFVSGFSIAGLDRRFGWSDISTAVIITADLIFVASYLFILRVFYENRFASRVIEVEQEQRVITTGPYRYVRHPMYIGMIVMYLSSPVVLGSWWAVIPFLFLPVSLGFRIVNEEKVLREHLKGYTEYCSSVRYRLIPYVW